MADVARSKRGAAYDFGAGFPVSCSLPPRVVRNVISPCRALPRRAPTLQFIFCDWVFVPLWSGAGQYKVRRALGPALLAKNYAF